MIATVVYADNPFRPIDGRRVVTVRRRRRIRALAPRIAQPYICLINGRPALRHSWRRRVRDGDIVAFVALPQGGGGRSNPLQVVAMIALTAVTFGAHSAALAWAQAGTIGATWGATGAQVFAAAVSAVVYTAGSALISSLIPPPRPPAAHQAAELAAPSPTYSLTAQGNMARPGAPIPVMYGRHIIYPDFAAMPYTEYSGQEQYLYQLMMIGQGHYDIEAIRIEDTVVQNAPNANGGIHRATGSFPEIDYQVVTPGGTVTLFPAAVIQSVEVSGQDMPPPDGGGNLVWVGPFTLNPSGTSANHVGIDIVAPRGLYSMDTTTGALSPMPVTVRVQARTIDADGQPTGSWVTLADLTYSAATTTPQRWSDRLSLTPGRYQVRVARTNAKNTASTVAHDAVWAGMRAYMPGGQQYGQVTLLALRMRASNSLSGQAARKINVIATRKLPIWTGSSWTSPTATRNPAWAIADILRNTEYGAGLPDSRIDLAGLLSLAQTWQARQDYFDGLFDTQSTIWEALQQVAKVGRAMPYMQGGIVRVVRDAPQTIPTAMFGVRNIARGSLRLDYTVPSDETADAIDVEYFDASTWQSRTVRAALPGSAQQQVARVRLFGVTSRDQAWREGMYMSACNRYRRRHITIATEMEGLIPSVGDLIVVQHDLPAWGQGGEVVSVSGDVITVSEPLQWESGSTHYIALRARDGSVLGPYMATPGDAPDRVVVSGLSTQPYTGGAAERTHYAFGPGAAQYIRARVLAVKPRSEYTIEISAVVESDYVHNADTGAVPPASAWQLPTRITAPIVSGLRVASDTDATMMYLSWAPAPTAERYLIEVSDGGIDWTRIGDTSASSYTTPAPYGQRTVIRVAAVGLTRGPWVEAYFGSSASYMWSLNAATMMWSNDSSLMWRY